MDLRVRPAQHSAVKHVNPVGATQKTTINARSIRVQLKRGARKRALSYRPRRKNGGDDQLLARIENERSLVLRCKQLRAGRKGAERSERGVELGD